MMEIVEEWIQKAEADFVSAKDLLNPPSGKPNHDLICFLSQQCVEKYLKGILQLKGIEFEKTHALTRLLDLVLPIEPMWEAWRSAFGRLSEYAVEFRYPGEWADPRKAKTALAIATEFRTEARRTLSLPS